MDWNKLFTQGIRYTQRNKKEELKEYLQKAVEKCSDASGKFKDFYKMGKTFDYQLGNSSEEDK